MSKLQQTNEYQMSMELNGSHNSQLNQSSTNCHIQPEETLPSNGQLASSSSATSSTTIWHQPFPHTNANTATESVYSKKAANGKKTPEEVENMNHATSRLMSRLAHDQIMVLHPDVDSPFVNEVDVVNRLLPYHLFQQPRSDLEVISSGKGKEKALDPGWGEEIHATNLALEFFKRREAIRDRWRRLKMRSGTRSAPDDQAYYLAQVVLDSDRSENAWLGNELRSARTELERLEREKRATANASRMSNFASATQTPMPAMQAQYYRGYPYAYTQAYGSTIPAPTISTFSVSPATSTNYAPYQTSAAIPVQLPVASLPALHALGIIPVPAASLPPEGQPQPPAVLRGSTTNGTILSLEINVSLLQSTQMSGLAMVLNSLVTRSNSAGTNNVSSNPGTTSLGASGGDSSTS